MTPIRILVASFASVLCMATLFVTVAVAAGPPAQAPGNADGHAQGVCFLHDLLR
jgi:hypothetical protein